MEITECENNYLIFLMSLISNNNTHTQGKGI